MHVKLTKFINQNAMLKLVNRGYIYSPKWLTLQGKLLNRTLILLGNKNQFVTGN